MTDLVLYDLAPSPNNIKARLALGYKGLPYRKRSVPLDGDRTMVIEATGQSLTPALRHGERVVFDSYAILRYLDGNFPKTPRLYPLEREAHQVVEEWELWVRTKLQPCIGMIFNQAFADAVDPTEIELANQRFHEATARIEGALNAHQYLLGEELTAADLTAAPFVSLGMLPAGSPQPIVAFFANHLQVGDGRPRTRAWVEQMMAYDRMPEGSPA